MSTPTPTKLVIDCESGEALTRPLDVDELVQWQIDQDAAAQAAKLPPPKPAPTFDQLAAAITSAANFDEAKTNLDQLTAPPPTP